MVACAVAVSLGAGASPAAARTNVDPCPGFGKSVLANGLHCGEKDKLCFFCTRTGIGGVEPVPCNRATEEIAGVKGERTSSAVAGDWDYWTENGEWILWNGQARTAVGDHGQPIDVIPQLHNWNIVQEWWFRVFFRCVRIP